MKEEATVVVENVKVTVVAKEKAMAVAEAETEEVLVEAEDVKVEAVQVDSEISLVNHVKAEAQLAEEALAEAEKEDADLNQHTINTKCPVNHRAFFLHINSLSQYRYLLDLLLFPVHHSVLSVWHLPCPFVRVH